MVDLTQGLICPPNACYHLKTDNYGRTIRYSNLLTWQHLLSSVQTFFLLCDYLWLSSRTSFLTGRTLKQMKIMFIRLLQGCSGMAAFPGGVSTHESEPLRVCLCYKALNRYPKIDLSNWQLRYLYSIALLNQVGDFVNIWVLLASRWAIPFDHTILLLFVTGKCLLSLLSFTYRNCDHWAPFSFAHVSLA